MDIPEELESEVEQLSNQIINNCPMGCKYKNLLITVPQGISISTFNKIYEITNELNNVKYIAKVMRCGSKSPLKKLYDNELEVFNRINRLKKKIPHFPKMYKHFKGGDNCIIYMSMAGQTPVEDVMKKALKKYNFDLFWSLVKQTFIAIYIFEKTLGMYHCDTHTNNFMVTKKKKACWEYNFDDYKVNLNNEGYLVKIIDFNLSVDKKGDMDTCPEKDFEKFIMYTRSTLRNVKQDINNGWAMKSMIERGKVDNKWIEEQEEESNNKFNPIEKILIEMDKVTEKQLDDFIMFKTLLDLVPSQTCTNPSFKISL